MTTRQDLIRDGAESYLPDIDLLATSLGSERAARALLRRFGTLRAVITAAVTELEAERGMSRQAAMRVRALGELVRRVRSTPLERGQVLSCAADIAAAYGPRLVDEKREHFLAIHLDVKNRVISDRLVSIGHLVASLVHPRETFSAAIRESAHSIAFVHQHPSYDPSPSREDIEITRRLMKVGDLLGISVIDHVVVAGDKHASIAELGLA
jgi:DNA repair protein RadC